jgi:hypothetical protein
MPFPLDLRPDLVDRGGTREAEVMPAHHPVVVPDLGAEDARERAGRGDVEVERVAERVGVHGRRNGNGRGHPRSLIVPGPVATAAEAQTSLGDGTKPLKPERAAARDAGSVAAGHDPPQGGIDLGEFPGDLVGEDALGDLVVGKVVRAVPVGSGLRAAQCVSPIEEE